MLDEILRAFALLLVIEGVLPFLSPGRMKLILRQLEVMPERVFRVAGFISMMCGLGLLYVLG